MTSRERVRRALEFDHPDRVPRNLWLLPIAQIEHGRPAVEHFRRKWPDDFATAPVRNPALAALRTGDPYAVGKFVDEWGCVFHNLRAGIIGEVKEPLLDTWSRLADLRPPLESFEFDRETVNRFCATSDKFVFSGCCPRPFERMQFLRGTENLCLDLAAPPAEFHELLRIVHEHGCKELEQWARTDVDGLNIMDDWGSQRSLLIAPRTWRELFKPLYRDYSQIAHAAGKKLFMHSDGFIFDIYEDLIEIGVDAINSQLFCMDIESIGRQFAGRLTFWGELDRQHVLATGTPADARSAVAQVVEHLFRPAGGVIAQFEFGATVKLANADAAFQAWADLTSKG